MVRKSAIVNTKVLTSKLFIMKKLVLVFTLAFLAISFGSCETEQIDSSSEDLNQKLLKQEMKVGSSCTLINTDPFSQSVSTNKMVTLKPKCSSYPGTLCFVDELEPVLINELVAQYPPTIVFPSQQTVSTENFFLQLSDVIDTSNIDPFIYAADADDVYASLACSIIDAIDAQGSLPSPEFYTIDITNLNVDFPQPGGIQEAFVELDFTIIRNF